MIPQPSSVGPLDLIMHGQRIRDLTDNSSEEQFFDTYSGLESSSPLSGAASECPYYVYMPPTLRPQEHWVDDCRDLQIARGELSQLFSSGFMPMSREVFQKKTLTDFFEALRINSDHTLVDTYYGLMLQKTETGMGNFLLDRAMLERMQQVHAHYKKSPASVLSIGAIRGHAALGDPQADAFSVREIPLSSRVELDRLITRVRVGLKGMSAQLWFRGQSSDYRISKLSGLEHLCPWRHADDTSLIPSLYRQAWSGSGSRLDYARMLVDLESYILFMRDRLQLKEYTTRQGSSDSVEKLSAAWGSYSGGLTATASDQAGNVTAIRDYHPGFSGLQQAFFLQHYGLPSNIMDITSDLDIALYFAQTRVSDGSVHALPEDEYPAVVYLFLLVPLLDRFIDSQSLSEHYGLERPLRQKCGLLCGASYITRNYYSRFIAIKTVLEKPIQYSSDVTTAYVYPDRSEDKFLDALIEYSEKADLHSLKPFVPKIS